MFYLLSYIQWRYIIYALTPQIMYELLNEKYLFLSTNTVYGGSDKTIIINMMHSGSKNHRLVGFVP